MSSSKRDAGKEDDVDIISFLPESVMCHILSLLPTKDAVKTCVLSKKWEYMWTCIYNMHFDDRLRFCSRSALKPVFVRFVNRVLLLSENATIRNFKISCMQFYDPCQVNEWICTVLRRKVQKLSLHCLGDGVMFPDQFSDSCSLVELWIWTRCKFRLYSSVRFSNLKFIHIYGVDIQNIDSSQSSQLLLSFPVLDTFCTKNCKWNTNLVKIDAPLVSSFEMIHCKYVNNEANGVVEVYGPGLMDFSCGGHDMENFVLAHPSSVSDVALNHTIMDPNVHLMGKIGFRALILLRRFSNLKRLILCCDVIEALDHAEPQLAFPSFNVLISLEIGSGGQMINVAGTLMSLIHQAPVLESLKFHTSKFIEQSYDEIEQVPACFSSHLQTIKLESFCGGAQEFRLVKFFLKNASVLNEMSIRTYRRAQFETEILAFAERWSRASVVFVL